MIASLKGKIILKKEKFVVLDVNGIGFKIYTKNGKQEEETKFFTRLFLQRDSLALFGFKNIEELEMFELLLIVSGVGPRSAMEILSLGRLKLIKSAIADGRKEFLSKAAGISKKTSERIIIELKDKLKKYKGSKEKFLSFLEDETNEALISLGYTKSQAREALKKIPDEIKDIEQRVKIALKNLGK